MTDTEREPPRQVWHFFLLVAFLFAVIISQVVAQRPFLYGMFNNVAPAGIAPPDVVPDPGEDWSVMIHRRDWGPHLAMLLGHTKPARSVRLGWVVREGSLLSLPLFGWRQSDLAAFTEDGYGYRLSGLTPAQLRGLKQRGAVSWFPWWRFVWGWLPLAAFGGFVWGELNWLARRRALLGIM